MLQMLKLKERKIIFVAYDRAAFEVMRACFPSYAKYSRDGNKASVTFDSVSEIEGQLKRLFDLYGHASVHICSYKGSLLSTFLSKWASESDKKAIAYV